MSNKNKRLQNISPNDYLGVYISLYNQWYIRLKNMLLSSIEWVGNTFYPEYCIPEQWICENGMAIAFIDDVVGFMMLPCQASASLNVVGKPSRYTAYGMNGYVRNDLIHGVNAVVIQNNPLCTPDISVVRNYTMRLTEIQMTHQVNLNANKTPVTIVVPEELQFQTEQMYAQFTLGNPKIIGNSNLSKFQPTAVQTGAPFLVPELSTEMRTVWAEWLTYLGTPGMDLQKSERLLQDEIAQAMGGAIACRSQRMLCRRMAAEKMETVLGIKMHPEFSVDMEPVPGFLNYDDADGEPSSDSETEMGVY